VHGVKGRVAGVTGRVTSRDIARVAGVSQPTVSRALRGDPRVAPATAALVEEAAARLGYVPHAAARSLITRRAGTVAVVVADIGNPFYTELVDALHAGLGRAGLRTVLLNERTDVGADAGIEPLLRSGMVDGAIVATATLDERTAALIAREPTPIVLVNREPAGAERDTVVSDNRGGGALVAELLAAELGHRRIAHVSGPANTSTARDREAGLREALEHVGVPLDPDLHRSGDYSHRDGYRCCLELLDLPDPPTAIFCGNDVIALGALDAARRRGIAVPGALSVVGFDDIALAGWESFRLSTVRQPLAAMALEAVRALVARVEGTADGPARRIVFPTELIRRATTGPAPAS
jgi:LacI family transcriptional regulator